jgi:hypothetical protein
MEEIKKEIKNELIEAITEMDYKFMLEDNEVIAEAYDNGLITHEDIYDVHKKLINKLNEV